MRERKIEYSEVKFRTIVIFFCVDIAAMKVIVVSDGFA